MQDVLKAAKRTPAEVASALPQIMNRVGGKIDRSVANHLSGELGIPSSAVHAAMITRSASQINLDFEIEASGYKLPYMEWITQHDDRVCPICMPRDGRLFPRTELQYMFPAHPNCRCEIHPVAMGSHLEVAAQSMMSTAIDEIVRETLEKALRAWSRT